MKRSGFRVMAELIGLVKPLLAIMLVAILMGLIGNLCATFITVLGGYAILDVLGFVSPFTLKVVFILLGAFALLRGLLRYAEQESNHYIAFKILALIRDKVFTSLRRLAPAKLEGKEKGNLISLITSDVELLEVFYAHTISPICIATLFTIAMVIYIGSFHIALAILALCAYLSVGVLIPVVISKISGGNGLAFRKGSGDLSSFVLESLRGLNETIQYDQGAKRCAEMEKKTEDLLSTEEKMKHIAGLGQGITNTVILIFDVAMLLLSSYLCDFPSSLICTLALMSSFGPCIALSSLGSTLQNTFASGNRVLDILSESPVVQDVENKEDIVFDGAKVANISFSYGNESVLKDFSLDIPEDKIIGLVGASGSGKSTLLKLLMRFWQVQNGKISISDVDIDKINTKSLRDAESYVTQETYLFHDSIKNNLKIAKLDATDEEIESACKKASIHDFIISLPNGYDTEVAELGDSLSAGEKQRLALARAFLHSSPFMLLDEPTSNLDSLNEAVILKSLYQERKGKTIVIVSHRKSTMSIADLTYEIAQGRVS